MEIEKSGKGDKRSLRGLELQMKCKDGSVVWTETAVSFIRDESGAPVGLQGSMRDISDRKRIEGALSSSQENFRNLIARMPDPVIVHRDRRVVYANSAALKFLDHTLEELEARPAIEFLHPDYHPKAFARRKLLEEKGFTPADEMGYLRSDGTIIFGEARAMQIVFDGKPSILVNIRDLTERKEAEAALRGSEEDYRLLIDRCPDPITVHDGKRFIYANDAVLQLLGYRRDEFLELPIREFLHPDDLGAFAERQTILDSGGRPPIAEFRGRRKDGSTVVVEVHAYSTTFDGRKARIVIARDVTERRAAETE